MDLELFLREPPRECYGVWTHVPPSQPLREWIDAQTQRVEAEMEDPDDAVEATNASWDASLAASRAIWWPSGHLQP